ncbi:hypothetical protein ACQ4M3_37200 [Leptolyngbya sp. AN03gr2]|uniref:hypothetical protein n=1 Tax=unclassified Leptolyngbya TaxID=2650499 RepID=UPI003D322264
MITKRHLIGISGLAGILIALTVWNSQRAKPIQSVCRLNEGNHVFVTPINTNSKKPEASSSNIAVLLVEENTLTQFCALHPGGKPGIAVSRKTGSFSLEQAKAIEVKLQNLDGRIQRVVVSGP